MQTASRGVIVNLFNHSLLLPHPGGKKITLLWTENKVGMKLKKKKRKCRSLLGRANLRMLSTFLCSEIKVVPRNRIFMSTEL